ncbi:hypothetical protein NL676_001267 [Syzygium grande]|nr:hypothetical protein NL676_001267 [Syzygium grande]
MSVAKPPSVDRYRGGRATDQAASSAPPSSVVCKASATTPVTRDRGAISAFLLARSLVGTPLSPRRGTYDARRRPLGPNGSIRNKEEYSHGANAGLKIALDFCGERSLLFLSYLPLGFSAFAVLIPLAEWCLCLFDIRA